MRQESQAVRMSPHLVVHATNAAKRISLQSVAKVLGFQTARVSALSNCQQNGRAASRRGRWSSTGVFDSQHRVLNVNSPAFQKRISTTLMVDGCPVMFQIDSGATCNVVRINDMKPSGPSLLQPTREVIRMYDHSQLIPLSKHGAERVNPKTSRKELAELLVVKDAPTAILGAETKPKVGTYHNQL